MTSKLAGRNALVTGASRGLGRSIAVCLAAAGARVGIGFQAREEDAQETLRLVETAGGSGQMFQFDVRDQAAVESAARGFIQQGQSLDILVNAAARFHDNLVQLMSAEEWQETIDVNLTGTFNCCRVALRFMMAARKGAIVNVGSAAGVRASPGQANYSASKGGVASFTATLAAEVASRNIRVNAVVPGLLDVGMGQRLDRRVAEARRAAIPLGRFGTGDEVARAVLFLASDDASYITGQSIVVDGGMTL